MRNAMRELGPWRARDWRARASLDRTGTRPLGVAPGWLVIVLVVALGVHALHPPSSVRVPPDLRADIIGRAWVIDGDTIDIAGIRIRLSGIDAPESEQTCTDAGNKAWTCGRTATRQLVAHLAGRPLKCQAAGLDRYHRVLAVCVLPDGSDVNAWMVREGGALAYYSADYQAEEAEAHADRRGIWSGSFMPPWEWRHRHPH